MKTMSVSEVQMQFSSLLMDIESGNKIAITNGIENKTIAILMPYTIPQKSNKRILGTLKNRAEVIFSDNFKMTEEELISL